MTGERIRHGATVVMHYTILLEDGMVADTTEGEEPFRFTVGDGSLIQGLELALFGLKAGDHQRLRISPENGFGAHDPNGIHEMPRAAFPPGMELEEGQIIGFDTPAGEELPGAILEVDEDTVKVDFNHPLAGHEITFEVEILSVESP